MFAKNHGLTPLEKCQCCAFLKPMFSLFTKACLVHKTSKIVFSQFMYTIYDMEIQKVKEGYMGLQGVTRGYRGLQGVTRSDKGLQGVTSGYMGLQRIIETFF